MHYHCFIITALKHYHCFFTAFAAMFRSEHFFKPSHPQERIEKMLLDFLWFLEGSPLQNLGFTLIEQNSNNHSLINIPLWIQFLLVPIPS